MAQSGLRLYASCDRRRLFRPCKPGRRAGRHASFLGESPARTMRGGAELVSTCACGHDGWIFACVGDEHVARLSALERLRQGLWGPPHAYVPSLQVFPDISVEVLARELDLGAKGEQRGKLEEPASNSATLDEVEHGIVERIYAERKGAYQELVDQLETYSRRLGALDFEGRFATIAARGAGRHVGEFKGGSRSRPRSALSVAARAGGK